MNRQFAANHIISVLLTVCAATAQETIVITPSAPANRVTVQMESAQEPEDREPISVALFVQNHAEPDVDIPMLALTDALTAKLSGNGFRVINPYNAVGVNQNRDTSGEETPEASALELARELGADGLLTASVTEFLDSTFGNPPRLHQFSIRVAFSLADVWTGAAICGDIVKVESHKYTDKQVEAGCLPILSDILHSAAYKCAEKLTSNQIVRSWHPQRSPGFISSSANLSISDIDAAVQTLFEQMRMNPVFRSNYDMTQGTLGRAPMAIIGGVSDLTDGKSKQEGITNLLAAASQGVRMAFVNSGLFDAKDDALIATMTQRIVDSGKSPLEDGELMEALKQHGSPDFYVVGDLMFFAEKTCGRYRLRLALHNLHTGKVVWEGAETITKPLAR